MGTQGWDITLTGKYLVKFFRNLEKTKFHFDGRLLIEQSRNSFFGAKITLCRFNPF